MRRRHRRFVRQHSAALKLQARVRGRAIRSRYAGALIQQTRMHSLERRLATESRARAALESALRALWSDFAGLREVCAPRGVRSVE